MSACLRTDGQKADHHYEDRVSTSRPQKFEQLGGAMTAMILLLLISAPPPSPPVTTTTTTATTTTTTTTATTRTTTTTTPDTTTTAMLLLLTLFTPDALPWLVLPSLHGFLGLTSLADIPLPEKAFGPSDFQESAGRGCSRC